MSKKILIIGHIDKNNKGNAALLITRINIFKNIFKNPEFIVFCDPLRMPEISDSNTKFNLFFQRRCLGCLFAPIKTLESVFFSLLSAFWSMIYRLTKISDILLMDDRLKAYRSSDIIITTGGDVLSEDYGILNFLTSFKGILFGILLNKPVVIYAESIGPFKSKLTTFIAKEILNRVSLITVRESISYNYLKEIGVNKPPIEVTADSAFLLQQAPNKNVEEIFKKEKICEIYTPDKILVGMSISQPISKWQKRSYDEYITIMAKITDYIVEKLNAAVIFVPHVTGPDEFSDDRIAGTNVLKKVKHKNEAISMNGDYTPEELKGVISKCDLFIGARMHANIAALSSCVPTIAISYSIKTPGIMKMVGQEKYVCNFKTMTFEELKSKVDEAWEHREEIREELKKKVKVLQEKALYNARLVKELVDSLNKVKN